MAGVLSKFHVAAGDTLDVGKPFFDVDPEGKKPEGAAKPAAESKPAESKSAPEPAKQEVSTPKA